MMMKRAYTALALLSVMALLPSIAEAGRYGGGSSGYVNTPFGTIPMSMMNQAGGNPFMASEMQQQQMMYQQQMMMMKQQQQYMQQMQQMQKAGKNPNGNSQLNATTGTSGSNSNPFASTSSSKKKKKTTHHEVEHEQEDGHGSARPTRPRARPPRRTTSPSPTDALSSIRSDRHQSPNPSRSKYPRSDPSRDRAGVNRFHSPRSHQAGSLLGRFGRGGCEGEVLTVPVDEDGTAQLGAVLQKGRCQGIGDPLLDDSLERTGAVGRVEPLLGELLLGLGR